MKRILTKLSSNPKIAVELTFVSLAANLLALIPPIFVILVLNRYVSYGVDATLITLASGTMIAIIFEYFFRRIRYHFATRLNDRVETQLGDRVFEKAIQAKVGYLNQIPSGTFRGIFSSVDQIDKTYSATNICTFFDAPFALLFLVALYFICPPISYLTLGLIVLLSVIVLAQLIGLRKLGRNLNITNALKGQVSNDVIELPETVRLFDVEASLREKWQKHRKIIDGLQALISDRQNRTQTIIRAFSGVLTVIVISAGALLVVEGKLDVGAMIGANILAARALTPIISICQQAEGWVVAEHSHHTLADFDRLPVEKLEGTAITSYSGAIDFREVSFSYPAAQVPLIEKLNFSLRPGEVLCISGKNGAGKSTLAKMIAGLIEPSVGYVLIDGINLGQVSLDWWRRQIIYLPQEPKFLDGTIRDNFMGYKKDLTAGEIRQLLTEVGLSDLVDKTVGGLDQKLNGSGSNISLGVRRRIALARALSHRGQLVVLDEPTEGIDALGASSVYAVMNQLSQEGKSLIVFSHDREILSGAHHFIDLDDGPDAIMKTVGKSISNFEC
jgi:ATP-binding cassette subfamily C protein LapB